MQIVVVYFSGSVALLADTIHNFGDAATAIPSWVAFVLVRRKPSLRFTYGLGRVEDLAGVVIVGLILLSAIVAGWQALNAFSIHRRSLTSVGASPPASSGSSATRLSRCSASRSGARSTARR